MGDAKARAEARRAKILAREGSKRTVSAVANEEDDILLSVSEVKGKDRPLAARRSFLKSRSEIGVDGETSFAESTNESTTEAAGEDTNISAAADDSTLYIGATNDAAAEAKDSSSSTAPPPESTGQDSPQPPQSVESKESKPEKPKASEKTAEAGTPKVKLPPAKTLEEIEREVAENTAKFDRGALSGGREKSKADKEKMERIKKLAGQKQTVSVDSGSLMRLIRLLVIGLLAAYTGYQAAEVSRAEALRSYSATSPLGRNVVQAPVLEFDEFSTQPTAIPSLPESYAPTNTSERTWLQYFQSLVTRRLESTVTAVMTGWWIAGLFKGLVNRAKASAPKSKENIIDQVYSFINGFQEILIGTAGEFAWHFFVLVMTVTLHSVYYQRLAQSISNQEQQVSGVTETAAVPASDSAASEL